MNNKFANYLLNKTKLDYNLIGHDFSSKRVYISPDIVYLKKYSKTGDHILDLGCGNGRLSEIFSDIDIKYIGVDISQVMIDLAREKYPTQKFEVIDYTAGEYPVACHRDEALIKSVGGADTSGIEPAQIPRGLPRGRVHFFHLPFPDGHFDKIYCLSVLHHIPSMEYRKKFLQEARRVLKPNGQLILTVWNLLIKPEICRQIIKNTFLNIIGKSQLDFKDIYLPFSRSKSEKLTDRYLHAFSMRELKALLSLSGFENQESGRLKRGRKVANENLYTIAIK